MTKTKVGAWLIGIVAILFLGLFLRLYRLDQVPAGLYIDEIDLGYQARSLVETGRDYRNQQSPFYVRSFNSDRTPLPAYLTALSTILFENPFWQVRGGAALAGTVVVLLVFVLIKYWTNSNLAGLLAALVFATSPWQLQFSRIAFEGTTLALVYLLGMVLFFWWLGQKKDWQLVLATIALSLSVYTYRTMSLFAPLTFVMLGIFFFKDLARISVRTLLLCGVLASFLMGSFLYATTLAASDQPRIAQISIFSDPKVPIKVMRAREAASGDYQDATLGQSPVWWTKLVFNKPVFWLKALLTNYFAAWSGQFLFLNGDANLRHGVGQWGALLLVDLLALLVGLGFVWSARTQLWSRWLLAWLVLGPIPAAITLDGAGHAHRLFIFALPLLLVVSPALR